MTQDEQYPERGYNTEDVAALRDTDQPKASFARRHWGKLMLAAVIGLPAAGLAIWTAIAMTYSYSSGDRTGYIQKFSKKGWLCKTYEGEMWLSCRQVMNAEKFYFSIDDKKLADSLTNLQDECVQITYKEHRRSLAWRGDSHYIVTGFSRVNQ